jgi:hypothetical protein
MSTGAGITLIAAGAILRFAVTTTSTHGLNVHAVGVILILAGAMGMVLPPLVRGPANRHRNRPAGNDHPAPPPTPQPLPQDQPPAASGQRAYQNQPPA